MSPGDRSSPDQGRLFVEGEADRWFRRNREALTAPDRAERDPMLRVVDFLEVCPRRTLEIGAANGYRVHALHERYGCEVTAVDPSSEALEDGRSRFPEVEFLQGVADDLPLDGTRSFDLVLVNYVFHWIDRSLLLRSVAEMDRVIADGGLLVIGDFHPARPQRVRYHHLPDEDVWTYKQDYAATFVASGLYERVAFHSYETGTYGPGHEADPGERGGVTVLKKTRKVHEVIRAVPGR